MSTDSVDILETKIQNDVYLHLVAFTFLYYDHLMTLKDEIRLIWNRPNTLSSYFFFINRYFSFFGNIGVLLSILFTTSCSAWTMYQEIFHALAQVIVASLLTLRIYALYDRNKRLLMILSGMVFGGVVLAIITDLISSSTKLPSSIPAAGCHDILDLKNAALVAVGWEILFLYDVLLFGMTLRKAYLAKYHTGISRFGRVSLFSVVIRDGTIYYAIMCLFNFLNVFTFYITGNSFLSAPFSSIASCMSVTLTSRLMLHLHQFAAQGLYVQHAKTIAPWSDSDWTEGTGEGGGEGEGYSMTLTTLWSSTIDRTLDDNYNTATESSGIAGPDPSSSDTRRASRTNI
ncbi:hypothetical protein GYMLUDRAFT_38363 [Collybiopsis luxurians FD-317 M1]|nr:hypothetical protein GYMLUDRAFT_38363 [Collybiopsis luxurians FD-317 M1]